MKKAAIAILITSALGLSACQQDATDPTKVEVVTFETEQQKQAYAMGAMIGQYVEKQLAAQENLGLSLDKSLVLKGFSAAVEKKSQLEIQEMQTIMQALETEMVAKKKAKNTDFIAENAKRDGVTVTESGLQYEVLSEGDGAMPSAEDTVKVHYRGTLLDGTEFDSSYSRNEPVEFPLRGVIPGWTEGLQLMKVGAKFKFLIPSDLAYGSRNQGPIPANSTLIFEVELLDIVTPVEEAK